MGQCGHALSENQRTWAPGGNGVHLSRGVASSPEARGPAVAHVEGMAPGVRQELPLSPHRPNILTHRGHCHYRHYCVMSRNLSQERKRHVRRRRGMRDQLHREARGQDPPEQGCPGECGLQRPVRPGPPNRSGVRTDTADSDLPASRLALTKV